VNLDLAAGPLTLRARSISIPYRDPFRIARSHEDDGMSSVLVELRHRDLPDLVGYGEGYPDAYYGEAIETMGVVLPLLLDAVDPAVLDADAAGAEAALSSAGAAFDETIAHHGAAKCALDIALHDLAGKRLGLPVHRLLGLSADIPPTDFTLGLDEPAVVAARAERAAGFPALKIKVGGPRDVETLEAVRRVYGGRLRVDANTGWQPDEGARLVPDLVRLGVELIEQPFPRQRMLERARDLGFRRFEGCMEETSVAIAASAAVASLADWVDLDGCLLIAADPFEGLELDKEHRWRLTEAPGLGVRPAA